MKEYLITLKNKKASSIFANSFEEAEIQAKKIKARVEGELVKRMNLNSIYIGGSSAIN